MSQSDTVRVAKIVEDLTPIPPVPSINAQGRAKWTQEYISIFEKIVKALDDGKFYTLLNSSSFQQARYLTLLTVFLLLSQN